MRKTIKLNGVDYTDIFTPTGYTVSYKKIRGNNSGYMLDGSYTDDVRAIKSVITCTCMPTNEDQLSQLLVSISNTYVSVYFYDPREKTYRTADMMPSDPSQKYRGRGTNSIDYWTGTIIQFTER